VSHRLEEECAASVPMPSSSLSGVVSSGGGSDSCRAVLSCSPVGSSGVMGSLAAVVSRGVSVSSSSSACPLFPLPLPPRPDFVYPSSRRRRRSYQRRLVVHDVATGLCRGLNTLALNFPSFSYAEGVRSASPSPTAAQQRLIAAIMDAAAAFLQPCRRAAVPPTSASRDAWEVHSGAAAVPGCTMPGPASRSGRPLSPSSPSSSQGSALFIFSGAAISTASASAPAARVVAESASSQRLSLAAADQPDRLHRLYQSYDLVQDAMQLSAHLGAVRSYADSLHTEIVPIRSAEVALPADLNNVPLLSLLPAAVAAAYASPSALLLPEAAAQQHLRDARLRQPRVFAERIEYLALVKRMMGVGMLTLTATPLCVNGLFATPKGDGTTRLILDARPANCYFLRPPSVKLPSPAHLAALRLPHAGNLFVAKLDLSNFYHQLALPAWMRVYFALPAVSLQELDAHGLLLTAAPDVTAALRLGRHVFPCCTTLPMGFSHSVFIAQAVHEHVLYTSGVLRPADNIVVLDSPLVDRPLHGLYIDDAVLLGMDKGELDALFELVTAAYQSSRLPPKLPKCTPPTAAVVTVLGVDVDGRDGVISLPPIKLAANIRATEVLLSRPTVSGKQLMAVVGSWTWPMLLRRPVLAAFKHVYGFAEAVGDDCRPLWPSAQRELRVVMALAPLLRADLRRADWSMLVATDASESGAGVVCTRLSAAVSTALWPVMTHAECSLLAGCRPAPPAAASALSPPWPALEALQPVMQYRCAVLDVSVLRQDVVARVCNRAWSTVIATTWRRQEHINLLEIRAMLLAVRWVLSHPDAVHTQLLLLVDSSTAFYGVRKGRSSSPHLLTVLRQYAALLLAGDVSVLTAWLPSDLNPADSPSRKYRVSPAAAG
jgi:hypothetical protein